MMPPEESRRATVGYSLAAASIGLAALGQILIKLGVGSGGQSGVGTTMLAAGTNPLVLVGLGSYVVSSMLWLVVLSKMDLAAVYPLGSASYVLVVLLSRLLGEYITVTRWFGVILIVLGIVLVSGWAGRSRGAAQ